MLFINDLAIAVLGFIIKIGNMNPKTNAFRKGTTINSLGIGINAKNKIIIANTTSWIRPVMMGSLGCKYINATLVVSKSVIKINDINSDKIAKKKITIFVKVLRLSGLSLKILSMRFSCYY
ncbi:hypothetical protein [Fructilactobacillus cliffordii]|uniref:Uncharacterized protein n=1 Tax=Fructilactobacillus cliffordii TaxID=2940299 RepID=A0A9Q8ZTC2_9LACO|nr:hypothetical protein [Fructilactobacillus cliffordii]USS88968.1 hypothetical protein M3M40_05635 [Fructilactobacillus cliffordii]